jgi:Domain of unknown function (DUF4412)
MKKILSLLTLLLTSYFADAQIINPKEILRRKTEQRANQKIDQTIDKALDGLFNSTKKPASNENSPTAEPNSGNGLLKGFEMGGKPQSSYNFSSSMVMKMTMKSTKEKDNFMMRTKYMFAEDLSAMSIKFMSSDNPDMAKASQVMDAVVMDFQQNKIFSFSNNDGQKMVMGIGIREDAMEQYVEKENEKIKVTKTSETKTIAGYLCNGYTVENEKDKITMWVSQNSVGNFAKMSQKMSQSSSFGGKNASSKNYMAYNAHPEFVKMANEGRVILGYSAQGNKGEQIDMEVEEVNPNDANTFSTEGYKSMFGN